MPVCRRRWQRSVAKTITAGPQHFVEQWRQGLRIADRCEHLANADSIPRLERSQLPAKSPSHGTIDVVYRVRNRWRDMRAVDERLAERAPEKRTDPVFSKEQAFDPGTDVLD